MSASQVNDSQDLRERGAELRVSSKELKAVRSSSNTNPTLAQPGRARDIVPRNIRRRLASKRGNRLRARRPMRAFLANAWCLFERVLDGIKPSLSARLILVGGAAADADATDMHFALSHDRQSTCESNDSGDQRQTGYHAPFEILTIGQFLNAASGKRKSC